MHAEKPPPVSERPASFGSDADRPPLPHQGTIAIYVHFPFCLRRCPYCSFTSVAVPNGVATVAGPYVEQLIRECAARVARLAPPRPLVTSLYLGGGTPSLMPSRELKRLLSAVSGLLPLACDVEITLECNPGTATEEMLLDARALGVNRLSIGVQSLSDRALGWLQRIHDEKQARAAIKLAERAGFNNIGADLILGIPVSSLSEEVRAARTLLSLGVTHLSAYALSIEEGTPFFAAQARGELETPTEARLARTFQILSEDLRHRGLVHYEISNYCRPGRASRHNLSVWRGEDYLGLGLGATGTHHDRVGGTRSTNPHELSTYLRHDFDPPDCLDEFGTSESLSLDTLLKERLMLGLRTAEGVDLAELTRRFRTSACPPLSTERITRLVAEGRLRRDGSRITIPHRFWHLSDAIIRDLW